MSNSTDSEMIACAQILRAAVNNETEITVTRRITISRNFEPKFDFVIYFGATYDKAAWKWQCAQADTLAETQAKTLAQIAAQGDERKRERQRLDESAAKLGLQLVEVQP